MKSPTLTTVTVLALFIASTVNAAPDILPGLWENKVEVSSKSGQFEQALKQAEQMLASLPPEQQKMMKDMMAKQGVNFDLANRTIQTCLTQAQIDSFEITETGDDCSQSFEQKSANHYTITTQCDSQNMSGQGDYLIKDNKHYTGTMVMDMDMNGQKDTITMKQEGAWLSADCGDVTPR